MFSMLSGDRVSVHSDGEIPLESILKEGVRGRADVSALASIDKGKLYVLAWHYHDDDVPGPDANVQITLSKLPVKTGRLKMRQFNIDSAHSNAFAAWQAMGSPQKPSLQQYEQLERAGKLAVVNVAEKVDVRNSTGKINLTLPRQAVALVVIEL
jgi:xylan 1,4-beta-xylosidase